MDYFTLDKELSKINEGDGTPMERNLQEILVLLNWLEQVGVVGASSSVLEYPVRMLDNHCQILLRTLAFDPSDTPHFSLFKKVRTRDCGTSKWLQNFSRRIRKVLSPMPLLPTAIASVTR